MSKSIVELLGKGWRVYTWVSAALFMGFMDAFTKWSFATNDGVKAPSDYEVSKFLENALIWCVFAFAFAMLLITLDAQGHQGTQSRFSVTSGAWVGAWSCALVTALILFIEGGAPFGLLWIISITPRAFAYGALLGAFIGVSRRVALQEKSKTLVRVAALGLIGGCASASSLLTLYLAFDLKGWLFVANSLPRLIIYFGLLGITTGAIVGAMPSRYTIASQHLSEDAI